MEVLFDVPPDEAPPAGAVDGLLAAPPLLALSDLVEVELESVDELEVDSFLVSDFSDLSPLLSPEVPSDFFFRPASLARESVL